MFTSLVGGLELVYYFSIQLGMSSSQLTNSYFSEGWLNHQPDILYFIIVIIVIPRDFDIIVHVYIMFTSCLRCFCLDDGRLTKISHRLRPASVGSSGCGRSRCFFSGRPAHRQVGSPEGRKSDGVGLKIPKKIMDYHGLSWIIIENIMDYHGWGLVAMIFPKMMGMGFSKTGTKRYPLSGNHQKSQ